MKQVRETAAAKAISAYVILNPKGEHVATLQAHFSPGGTVRVDCWQMTSETQGRSLKAFLEHPPLGFQPTTFNFSQMAHEMFLFQHGRAGGGGYDKFTAALSNMIIDGHEMTDHCASQIRRPRGKLFKGPKAKKGYRFANWTRYREGHFWPADLPKDAEGYMNCYRLDGLNYLIEIGYQVVQAI